MFLIMPKYGVNICPPFFGKTRVSKNNLQCICSKDDVNTPSAIYFSHDDNYVSAMFMLRAIVIYGSLILTSCSNHTL